MPDRAPNTPHARAKQAAERIVDLHADVLLGSYYDGTQGRMIHAPEKPVFRDRDFAVEALAAIIREEFTR